MRCVLLGGAGDGLVNLGLIDRGSNYSCMANNCSSEKLACIS